MLAPNSSSRGAGSASISTSARALRISARFALTTCSAICPKAFAIDESGRHLVWVEDDVLVVVEVDTGRRVAEVRMIDGTGRDVDSLDVRDQTVLVNAYDRNTGVLGRPYVYGFDGTSVQLPVVGSATFAR